jgi:hypothetical protein
MYLLHSQYRVRGFCSSESIILLPFFLSRCQTWQYFLLSLWCFFFQWETFWIIYRIQWILLALMIMQYYGLPFNVKAKSPRPSGHSGTYSIVSRVEVRFAEIWVGVVLALHPSNSVSLTIHGGSQLYHKLGMTSRKGIFYTTTDPNNYDTISRSQIIHNIESIFSATNPPVAKAAVQIA